MLKSGFITVCRSNGYNVTEEIDYRGKNRIIIRKKNEEVGISLSEDKHLWIIEDFKTDDDVKDFLDFAFRNDNIKQVQNILFYIKDKDYVLDNVYPFLLPKNEEIKDDVIREIPSNANDLVIVYKVRAKDYRPDLDWSIVLTKGMLEFLSIQAEELKLRAVENFRRRVSIKSMFETIKEISGMELPPEMNDNRMYVITCDMVSSYGLADEYTLNKVCDLMNTDSIVIIPSSINEIIAVRNDGEMSEDDLNNMVHDVNTTELSEHDRLSDHVYHYDRFPAYTQNDCPAKDHTCEGYDCSECDINN